MEGLEDNLLVVIIAGVVLGLVKAGKDKAQNGKEDAQTIATADALFESEDEALLFYEAKVRYLKEAKRERANKLVAEIEQLTHELREENEDAYMELAENIAVRHRFARDRVAGRTHERRGANAG